MKARVRSPGASAAVTASADVLRTSREGSCSRDRASSSVAGSPSSSTSREEVSSPKSRVQAVHPVTAFSVRIRSSGSDRRCSR